MQSRRIKNMKKAPVSRRYPLISAAILLLVIVIAMTAGVYAEDDRFESLRELPVVEKEFNYTSPKKGGLKLTKNFPSAYRSDEQTVTVLFRFSNAIGMDTGARAELDFRDGTNVRDYAKEAMQWAVASGLINGDNGRLMADESITREQMAAIITRFVGLMK